MQLPDIRIHNFVDVSNQQFVTVCILHIYSSVDYTDICYICWCQQLIFNETFIYAYDVYRKCSNKRPPSNKRPLKYEMEKFLIQGCMNALKVFSLISASQKILFMNDAGHIFKENPIFVEIFGQFGVFFLGLLNKRPGVYSSIYGISRERIFLLFTHTYISLEWNSTDTYSLDDTLCMKLLRYKHTSLNFF